MNQDVDPSKNEYNGVIWISGFSASGKTTIGRMLESKLKKQGFSTLFLDGDDLRSIFGQKWGFARDDRMELARVYLRLCSHLSSQGTIVILSAVALYKEVGEWFRTNIPRGLHVYLDVPQHERQRRDAKTKQLYNKQTDFISIYDDPSFIATSIINHEVDPEFVVDQIIDTYLSRTTTAADFGRKKHWNKYYSKNDLASTPSSFAQVVANQLAPSSKVIEVGCGNGRDALFFASEGHTVFAIDASETAISICQQSAKSDVVQFRAGVLSDFAGTLDPGFNAIYCRFVLHAMPLADELTLLSSAAKALPPGGMLFIECRSIRDPLARLGEAISPTERIHGHYRRFIILDELRERVHSAGFCITSVIESNNLAVCGQDNPVVIRLFATRENA